MDFSRIIIKPILTEKSHALSLNEIKKYVFEVDRHATKNDIKIAFMSIYGLEPVKIATLIRKPARIKTGTRFPGMSKVKKIAYITLKKGEAIETEAEAEEAKTKNKKK